MPLIKKTNTILYCNRWEVTVAFYRDCLGLDVAFQNEWLVEFSLTQTSFLSVADQSRTTMSSDDGKGITLSFQIDDIKAVHRAFTSGGLAPTDIRSQVMGGDVFFLFDPEGTRIEFWCPV
jgi:predicted enzyme related to lactoylglutathione lyase